MCMLIAVCLLCVHVRTASLGLEPRYEIKAAVTSWTTGIGVPWRLASSPGSRLECVATSSNLLQAARVDDTAPTMSRLGTGKSQRSGARCEARQSDQQRGDASSEETSWPGRRRFLERDSEEDDRRSLVVREKRKNDLMTVKRN